MMISSTVSQKGFSLVELMAKKDFHWLN